MARKATSPSKDALSPDQSVALWVALMQGQATVAVAVSEKLESEVGITLAWHDVLVRLSMAPEGRLRMQELADSMLISKSGLTRLCDRMEAAGYLTRASCPTDRRGTFAVITPLGRAKAEQAKPIFFKAAEELFLRHLSGRERDTLGAALRKVITANGGHLCWSIPHDDHRNDRT
jgi:DNA-binding MarR family transcriptional regulator